MFERQADDALKRPELLGVVSRHETREHVNGAESGIPRRDAVLAFGFEEAQESDDALRREVGDLEAIDGAFAVSRHELQQQEQCIPIAVDGMRTHAALHRQVIFEEADEVTAKIGWVRSSHDAPRSTT